MESEETTTCQSMLPPAPSPSPVEGGGYREQVGVSGAADVPVPPPPSAATSPTMPPDQPPAPSAEADADREPAEPPVNADVPLLLLPSEILNVIFSFLPAGDLANSSRVCRVFNTHASTDTLWRALIRRHCHSAELATPPHKFNTFKEVYAALDPLWFLAEGRLWFSDDRPTGRVMAIRFDHHRAVLEGFHVRVQARAVTAQLYIWTDPISGRRENIWTRVFKPRISLHLDMPQLEITLKRGEAATGRDHRGHMVTGVIGEAGYMQPDVKLCRATGRLGEDPVWPSLPIPAAGRRSHVFPPYDTPMLEARLGALSMAQRRSEVARHTFLMPGIVLMDLGGLTCRAMRQPPSMFAAMDRRLYTATDAHPWRGIWVGDYGLHGVEFVLIHQPGPDLADLDDYDRIEGYGNPESDAFQPSDWTPRGRTRPMNRASYRADLRAIKLTGDTNIPRGEVSFYVPRMGEPVQIPGQPPVGEAGQTIPAVRSRGHVAEEGLYNDRWVHGWLFLISKDRLSKYWRGMSIVNSYYRLDIDRVLRTC